MTGIRKVFLQFIFSGAQMKRWNDKLRPMDMFEVDKQAHKMIVAWLLLTLNSQRLPADERIELTRQVVEGGIFDYFYRLIITDIKPPVFYRIKENREHYAALSRWVLDELSPILSGLPGGVWERFQAWTGNKVESPRPSLAEQILDAAHMYASSWEFNLIKDLNWFDEEIPEIEESFRQLPLKFADLPGASELYEPARGSLSNRNPLARFAALCGQLRFQARWSQTPRIPETSVMGHMFMVGAYAYFYSLYAGACRARALNNFFAGLFHDLPELLTRDIISPVKKSVEDLDRLLHDYEMQQMQSRVFTPLLEGGYPCLAERLSYLLGLETGSEFHSCARLNGKVTRLSFDDLHTHCNQDEFDPKDGELLKMCDELAAFLEAYTAVRNGVTSPELQGSMWRLKNLRRNHILGNIHFGAILADFD
ncbi:MAG: HD domain-containing protein [Desulfovibrionaceae bacterium]|nr:HD domain-containing protein [Desulfovibrionaceae bacterium]